MDPLVVVDALIKGLLTGMVYGLMALGLSVIFGVMRVVNFAHGEMMVAGMYLTWMLFTFAGIEPVMALPLVAAALFAAGWALQRWLIGPRLHMPEHMQFILLLGVSIIIVNGCLLAFGPDTHPGPLNLDSLTFGPFIVDETRLHAAGLAVAIAAALWLFFTRTRTGKAIRAAADNHAGALVVGLDVQRLYAVTFGIGAACVGAAGVLMLTIVPVQPFLAIEYTLLAFVIVIVGGLGSMTGALAGGLLIGVSEALAAMLIQPSLKSMFSFGLLILVLLLRPQGLLAKRS